MNDGLNDGLNDVTMKGGIVVNQIAFPDYPKAFNTFMSNSNIVYLGKGTFGFVFKLVLKDSYVNDPSYVPIYYSVRPSTITKDVRQLVIKIALSDNSKELINEFRFHYYSCIYTMDYLDPVAPIMVLLNVGDTPEKKQVLINNIETLISKRENVKYKDASGNIVSKHRNSSTRTMWDEFKPKISTKKYMSLTAMEFINEADTLFSYFVDKFIRSKLKLGDKSLTENLKDKTFRQNVIDTMDNTGYLYYKNLARYELIQLGMKVGISHGDYHFGNIMLDQTNKYEYVSKKRQREDDNPDTLDDKTLDILFELLDKSPSSPDKLPSPPPSDMSLNPINDSNPVSTVVSNLPYNPDAKITIIDYGLARELPDAHWKELEESMNRFDKCKGDDAIEYKMFYYKYALNILYGQYSAHDNALWDKELRHLYGWIRGRSYISGVKDFEIESENITNNDLNAFIEVIKVKNKEKVDLTELAKRIGILLPFNPEQNNTFYKKGGNAKPVSTEIKKQLDSVVETIRAWKNSIDELQEDLKVSDDGLFTPSRRMVPLSNQNLHKMIPENIFNFGQPIAAYGWKRRITSSNMRRIRKTHKKQRNTRKQKTRRHKS